MMTEMKRQYIVETHIGAFTTYATSEKKAISNIRFRVYGRQPHDWHCQHWTAREVA